MGWTAGVLFQARKWEFSVLHSIQADSGTHPASYPMDPYGSFPMGEAVGAVKLTTHLQLVLRSRMAEV
jgi:hypothetical protein